MTGGTGFIGGHFIRLAQEKGHDVVALRRPGSRNRIKLRTEPTWYEAELNDVNDEVLSSCDALFHFAAQGVSPQKTDWLTAFHVNVMQSLGLMHQADRLSISHVICCGSCFEYGLSGERYDKIPVDAPLEPIGPYAASKAAFSVALTALAHSSKKSWTLLRPFHLYGSGQDQANFWPSMRKAALAGQDFLMTSGEQIRDYMAVEDAAQKFLDILIIQGQQSDLIVRNIGSGDPVTMQKFAEKWWLFWQASGRLKIGELPYREGETMRFVPEL